MKLKVSLLTIESESADPAVFAAIRKLLRRAGVQHVVVATPSETTPPISAPNPPISAAPETQGEKVLATRETLSTAAQELGRRGGQKGGVARAAALSPEERSLAGKAAADARWSAPRPAEAPDASPIPPALAGFVPTLLAVVSARQGIGNGELATALFGNSEQGSLVRTGRLLTPLIASGRIQRSGEPGRYEYRATAATPATARPQAEPAAAPPRVEHAIADLVRREATASARLDGETRVVEAPTIELGPRILKAVQAQPGTAVPTLAQMLLGGADQTKLRQIESALQQLSMRNDVYRANGRVFPSVKAAAAAPTRSTAPQQTPAAVDQKALYDKLVAEYAKRNDSSVTGLARLLFGEANGITVGKVRLMTKQLCASERLKRIAYDSYRPWNEKQDRAAEDQDESGDDAETDSDDDAGDEKSTDLESNGQPDENDGIEELDVG